MFEAATLYFGDKKPIDIVLDSRAEAEKFSRIQPNNMLLTKNCKDKLKV